MKAVEKIVRNEPVEDVLKIFALFMGPPRLDRMYGQYKKEAIESGELWKVYRQLIEDGILIGSGKGEDSKGSNWKAPAFFTERRYVEDEGNE